MCAAHEVTGVQQQEASVPRVACSRTLVRRRDGRDACPRSRSCCSVCSSAARTFAHSPAATMADAVLKAGALLGCQIASTARLAAQLPWLLWQNATQRATPAPEQGATYYEGRVAHIRRRPVENKFEYAVRMVLVDLQQPPAWFLQAQAADHMSAAEARAFAQTDGDVLLLTNPVVAGYTQNPISVYYCHAADGRLAKAIAEVTNTPWGERVTFLFNPAGDTSPKALHVSPFMDMDNTWHLKASAPAPGARLCVSVGVRHPQLGAYFDASLVLAPCAHDQQCPAERAGLATLLRFGFMPQRVAAWIYWQALVLVAKGVRVQPKPPPGSFRPDVEGRSTLAFSGRGTRYAWREALAWPWYL